MHICGRHNEASGSGKKKNSSGFNQPSMKKKTLIASAARLTLHGVF